jgi:pyruvate,water dikinase
MKVIAKKQKIRGEKIMEKKYTLYFDEIDKKDLPLVGGKGANLGEMTKAGFPVPFGFCVTTESYKEFINYNKLYDFIVEEIEDANLENISKVGAKIREKIEQSEMPEKVTQEIIKAVQYTGIDNYYAVRSSATAEDLAFASFAGQQDTYLNIKGKESIINSVRNCWASLFTDRAILYRLQNKIQHEKVHMSVVVQKMVLPDIAGIMFTADPVSGHRGIISIDASYGLGEALVSGLVSPDIYKFKKKSMKIESKNIADKKLAIMPIQGGGTKKVDITGEKSKSQVMKDSQIKKLSELGMKIEKHYGCPQDIEWCLENDNLYIVQSRAITSLFPLPTPMPNDDGMHTYISINHLQVMTDPISPLGIDIFRNMLPFGKGVKREDKYKILTSAGGRIYADINGIMHFKKLKAKLPAILSNADALMAEALGELIQRKDFDAELKGSKPSLKPFLKYISPIAIKIIKNLVFTNPEGTVEFMNNYIKQREENSKQAILSAKQGVERLDAIYEAANLYEDTKIIFPYLAPGVLAFKALEKLEKKLLGTDHYTNIIAKGLEGNITTEMGLLTGDLADMIRKSQSLINEFEKEDYRTLVQRINKMQGNDEFKKNFNAFINQYGVRASGEIDIARERWIENPEPLVKSILATINTSKEGIHREEYRNTIEKAKIAAEDMVKEIEAKHGKLKAKIARRFIRVLRNDFPIREHHKFMMMRLCMIFKKVFLEEAKILVEKNYLDEEKDIFYIGFGELYKAIENNESLKALVEQRKEEYEHYGKLSAPRVITSEGEEIKAGYKRDNLPEGALVGIPVSSGVIEGIAKVITDPSKAALNKGEILVAPFTDPGWTPLFINADGLVMEVGGLLTHGTVVAREYGIPAVVGISDATKKIKTGQKIRVDGNSGYVMVIEE